MITELDIEAAVLAVDQAAQDVTDAEALPLGASSGLAWAAAQGRLRTATANHARLVEQRAAELEAEAAADAAEKANTKRLATMTKEMQGSRDKLHAAIIAAQDALTTMVAIADEHDALIAALHRELAQLGVNVRAGYARDYGATMTLLRGPAVLLHGTTWSEVNGIRLFTLVTELVRRARSSHVHNGLSIEAYARGLSLGYDRADLKLTSLPRPAEIERKEVRVRAAQLPKVHVSDHMSNHERQEALRSNESRWTTYRPDRVG